MRFAEGLEQTVAWYRDNRGWWEPIRSGDYRAYYERQYGSRSRTEPATPALRPQRGDLPGAPSRSSSSVSVCSLVAGAGGRPWRVARRRR